MRVDHVHKSICPLGVGDFGFGREFAPEPNTIPAVRKLVRVACIAAGVSAETLELLVAEAATNALRHAATPYGVYCVFGPCGLRFEVRDYSQKLPVLREAGEFDEGGRGLQLMAELAEHHVVVLEDGKIVCLQEREPVSAAPQLVPAKAAAA